MPEHQKLIQTSLDGFWVASMQDARILEVNDAFCNMVGYTREELLTMCVSDLDANESPAETAAHCKKVMEAGYDRFETRHRHKLGRLIDLEVSVSYSDVNGGVFFVFVRDITERKRTEDALYFVAQRGWMGSDENFFDALAQYLGGALGVDYVVIDRLGKAPGVAETVALYAKGAIVPNLRYDLTGTPCENVMGRKFCFYPQGIQQLFPCDSLLAKMGAESYAGIPLWDSAGQPIGLIAVMDSKPLADEAVISRLLQLVAIRAAAELERERSDRVLREREREFRSLAECSPDSIIRYDRDGRILYLNDKLQKLLELASAEEVIGKRPGEVWTDGRFAELERAAARVADSGSQVDIELVVPTENGAFRYHQIFVVPERDMSGQIVGTIAFGREITAIREAERQLKHFIANLPGMAYTFRRSPDGHGCFPFISPAVEKFYGLKPEDVQDDMAPLHSCWHPDDQMHIEAAAAESARTMTPFRIDARVCRPGQPERWLEGRALPEREADGSILWYGLLLDITERKQAEWQLKEALEFSVGIINAIPDVLFEVDGNGRYLNVWTQRPELLAAQREMLLGKTVCEVLSLEGAGIAMDAIREAEENGASFGKVIRIDLPHGEAWFEHSVSRKQGGDSSDARYLVLSRDVTERIQAQQRIALLERAINQFSDAVFLIDKDIRFTYVNEAACRSLGYSREEFLKLTPPDIDPDLTREMVMALMRNGTEAGSVFEARHRAKDGRIFPVELSGVTFKRDSKVFSLVTARDITARKHTEAQLKERFCQIEALNSNLEESARILRVQTEELAASQEHLKQTEAWYRSILRSAPDGMVVTDPRGVIAQVNAQIEAMFGYADGELVGQPVELLMPPDVRKDHVGKHADFAVTTAGEHPKSVSARGLRGYRKDGTEFPVDVSLSRLPDINGKVGYVCAAIRDTSERKKMEQERIDHLRHFEEVSRHLVAAQEDARQRLACELHDRTSPNLAAIDISLNVVAEEFARCASSGIAERLEDIRALISDTAASIREIGAEMRPPLLDYAGLIAAMENHALLFARRTGIRVDFECKNEGTRYTPEIESLLFRIFQEALTNCSKHSGASSIRIALCNDISPNMLTISDDGAGFDPEQLGKTGKIGLGLLNMREMAEVAGVKIAIESAVGKGTCITVEI
ncbi:MAG TPA: PAS domain S-box protein [Gallionella sp.]|nr:PAS domain S-box protein [Gallionella sp.]